MYRPLPVIREFIPFITDHNTIDSQPIYLIDIDGTLITSEDFKVNMTSFLRNKPNIYLFTKMSID
jgi:hypothetical protein